MTVAIKPGSGKINIIKHPVAKMPLIQGMEAVFKSEMMHVEGEITLTGNPGESARDWELGWIQMQFIDTDWSYYRGVKNEHGSTFVQSARPPARPQQVCHDSIEPDGTFATVEPDYFLRSPAGAFPLRMKIRLDDSPENSPSLFQLNSLTEEMNYLREFQSEMHFCTVLTAYNPIEYEYQHQAFFYWNLRWQTRFEKLTPVKSLTEGWKIIPVAGGNRSAISKIFQGEPTDPRFANQVIKLHRQNCNEIANNAARLAEMPGSPNRRESRVWENFNVTR